MKELIRIIGFTGLFLCTQALTAQPIAALHQSGEPQFFSGTDAFQQAYEASVPGATIYLSGGTFVVPDTIAKTITVFGAGHHPDYTGATGKTMLSGSMLLAEGAHDSHFEGLHIINTVTMLFDHRIDNLVFRRCRIDGQVYSNHSINYTNFSQNILFTECIFTTHALHTLRNARNLTISNSILSTSGIYSLNHATIENNIFLYNTGYLLNQCSYTVVRNNIVANNNAISGGSYNSFYNNVFFNLSSIGGSTHYQSNNYFSVERDNFFVDQSGQLFEYTHDYHLRSPEQYTGTDGSQVGIFGGPFPFKEGSVPMIPHIVSKKISHTIDEEGKLQVEIEVSAQEH